MKYDDFILFLLVYNKTKMRLYILILFIILTVSAIVALTTRGKSYTDNPVVTVTKYACVSDTCVAMDGGHYDSKNDCLKDCATSTSKSYACEEDPTDGECKGGGDTSNCHDITGKTQCNAGNCTWKPRFNCYINGDKHDQYKNIVSCYADCYDKSKMYVCENNMCVEKATPSPEYDPESFYAKEYRTQLLCDSHCDNMYIYDVVSGTCVEHAKGSDTDIKYNASQCMSKGVCGGLPEQDCNECSDCSPVRKCTWDSAKHFCKDECVADANRGVQNAQQCDDTYCIEKQPFQLKQTCESSFPH